MPGPLAGLRLVVTRGKGPSSHLAALLAERGASVLEVPSIVIVPPPDWSPLDEALGALERYGWVVLTSANAVAMVLGRIAVLGLEPRLGGRGTRVASVGRATTAALRASFPEDRVALEPKQEFRAEGLAAAFADRSLAGKRILVPASTAARDELPDGLRRLGAQVDVVAAYTAIEPPGLEAAVARCLNDTNRIMVMMLAKKRAADRKEWLEKNGNKAEVI